MAEKFLILASMFIMNACIPPTHEKPDDPRTFTPSEANIHDISTALPYFTDYNKAIEITGLTGIMSKNGPNTFFMPNNNAFAKYKKENKISDISMIPKEKLTDILLYHIISGRWKTIDKPQGYFSTLLPEKTSGNPVDIYIDSRDLIRLNGEPVIEEPDLESVNGVIHSIDEMIKIPVIITHLAVNENFSLFLELLSRNDLANDYLEVLSDDGPFTIIAPSNSAFESFWKANKQWHSILEIPAEDANHIVENHIIPSSNVILKKSNEIISLKAINGNKYTVVTDDSLKKLIYRQNDLLGQIRIPDIQASNGVIHQIDMILQ